MRAIIRFSLNADKSSTLRNQLRDILVENSGFTKHGSQTATYENTDISESDFSAAMCAFWEQAANPPNGVTIDHVWAYCDNPPCEHAT